MSDLLLRAYARLQALRANVNASSIPEVYIVEYHEILDQIESSGVDLAEFRVGSQHLKQHVISWNRMTGHRSYSDVRYVQGAFFRSKLDAVLMYFSCGRESGGTQREVGFTAS